MSYLKHFNPGSTPQSQPIPGRTMVKNNAGGYVFEVTNWDQLNRFLILGSEGGTYYVSERKLTVDNADCILKCLAEDGLRVVQTIVDISNSGRAFKNTPAIFALALAASYGLGKVNPIARPAKGNKKAEEAWQSADATRKAALDAFASHKVVRTGTHLFQFIHYVSAYRGWGRGLHRACRQWYANLPVDKLAYQVVKYPSRIVEEGVEKSRWSHRDILRKRLGASEDTNRNRVFDYAVHGRENLWKDLSKIRAKDLRVIVGTEKAKAAKSAKEVAEIISEYQLPHEAVPTEFKKDPSVWGALFPNMPLHATVRNLGSMTANGFLTPMSDVSSQIVSKLNDAEYIKKSRMHPLSLLVALKTYAQGKGFKGSLTWTPVREIVDALNDAIYLSFDNVEKTGKKFLLSADVSGSMRGASCSGLQMLPASEAIAVMALATAKAESAYHFEAFDTKLYSLSISPRQRIDDVIKSMNVGGGGTNCSLSINQACEQKKVYDGIVIYTDNETWGHNMHPQQAFEEYLQKVNPNAKLVVVAMTSTEMTIGDRNHPSVLNVVGFDTSTPQVIAEFIKGF